jgi:hypothetical protein
MSREGVEGTPALPLTGSGYSENPIGESLVVFEAGHERATVLVLRERSILATLPGCMRKTSKQKDYHG